jgi:hypothetical protein
MGDLFYLYVIGWLALTVLLAYLFLSDPKRRVRMGYGLRALRFLTLLILVLLAVGYWYHPEDFTWRINRAFGWGSVEEQQPPKPRPAFPP